MSRQKKLVEMDREELLSLVHELTLVLARKYVRIAERELSPNDAANRRHQYMKKVWGRKKLAMLGLLHKAQDHCPPELAEEIKYVLDHEENHYQRRDASDRLRSIARNGHAKEKRDG